jgi:Spy/CpxP family protein refolding chaperone/peroxiredoxin
MPATFACVEVHMKTRAWMMAVVLMTGVASAQTRPAPPPPPGERPGPQMLERIRFSLGELKLTEEQKTKVDAIFREARQGMDAMRRELADLEPRQRMEKIGAFFQDVRDDVAAVLTEEQRAILDKKLEEARQNMRNRFGQRRGDATTTPAGPVRPGEMLDRLRSALPQLDLNDAQRQQVKALLEDVQAQAATLRQQAEAGGENVREKVREMTERTRSKLNEILTPAQREKLMESLRDEPRPRPAATQGAMMMEGEDMMMSGGASNSAGRKVAAAAAQQLGDPSKAKVGTPAPQFSLKKLDGSLLQLSALKGRVVVLEFGSWTCPSFRDRAAAMEKLRSDYSTRAQFFIVYTREAHAKDEWEVARNKDLEIVAEQPRSMDERVTLAKKSRDELKLTTPIVVDSMGNDTAIAYGAGPNSAVVINRDGVIVARQQWFDPSGLRRAIDEAIKAAPTTKPAS